MRHTSYYANAGEKSRTPGYRFIGDAYEQFQVIYVSSGELCFSSDSQEETLSSGGAVLLREGSTFELSSPRTGYMGVCFVASGDLPVDFRGSAETLLANAEIRLLAEMMQRQLTHPTSDAAELLTGLGRALAWEAVRISRVARGRRATERTPQYWAQAARQVLDATLYSGRTARDVLSSLPLSYRQLSRYFLREQARSPKQYQIHARITEAKRLLGRTSLSITSLAAELGYCSSQHFATQFLAVTGCCPSFWRARAKVKSK